ncbi:hypothetical protein V1478_012990 [Vespula squamosa]|uniref:Uncharacterized protein n=1 Tax=Vespula squamosa TaxID=30214 RepID=A0ABD2AC48_VESSQ
MTGNDASVVLFLSISSSPSRTSHPKKVLTKTAALSLATIVVEDLRKPKKREKSFPIFTAGFTYPASHVNPVVSSTASPNIAESDASSALIESAEINFSCRGSETRKLTKGEEKEKEEESGRVKSSCGGGNWEMWWGRVRE